MLTAGELATFRDNGFVAIREAFPRQLALDCAAHILRVRDAPGLDREIIPGYVHLRENFDDGPFQHLWNQRLASAVDGLLEKGAYHLNPGWGWWPISFPGYAPSKKVEPEVGWHIDGEPLQRLGDPEYAVILLCLFSDIDRWGGGTFIEQGSYRKVVRFMHQRQQIVAQVPHSEINDFMHRQVRGPSVEVTGHAGDVILMHPYSWHCRGYNFSDRIRVVCNSRCILDRQFDLRSPQNVIETTIVNAIEP
jgi:hypothetical protein